MEVKNHMNEIRDAWSNEKVDWRMKGKKNRPEFKKSEKNRLKENGLRFCMKEMTTMKNPPMVEPVVGGR